MATKYKVEITGKDKSRAAFASLRRSTGNAEKSVRSMQASIGVLLGGAGLVALGKRAIESADKIQKLSIKLGASTEALSQFKHVANLSGIEFSALTKSLQKMQENVSDAARGTGEAEISLRQLGLSAKVLKDLAPEDQYKVIAEAMSGLKNATEKTSIATNIFGGRGAVLLQTMTDGAAGINNMMQEADQLGLTLSGPAADAAARANDELTRMGASVSSLATIFVTELGPAVGDAIQWLNESIPNAINATKTAVDILIAGFARIRIGIAGLTGDQEAIRIWSSIYDQAIDSAVERTTQVITISNKASEANQKFAETYKKVTAGVKKYSAAQSKAGKSTKVAKTAMEKYKDSLLAAQSELDIFVDKQALLDDLFIEGRISAELYEKELGLVADKTDELAETTKSAASEMDETWSRMTENMQRAFGDLIYDNMQAALTAGEFSFKKFTETIRDLFLRMIADMVAAWAVSKIAGFFGLGSGGGGFSFGGGGSAGSAAGGVVANAGLSAAASAAWGKVAGSSFGKTVGGFFGGGGGAVNGGGLLGPTIAGPGAATSAGVLSAPPIGTGVSPVYGAGAPSSGAGSGAAGGAIAAWGAAAAAAYIVVAGAMKSARIDKENAKLTDEFNRLRLETDAFAGEGVKVSDTLSIIGDEMGALYIRATENENGIFPDVETFYDQLTLVGAELRTIYTETGDAIAMITGNIEGAQALIEQGFDNATLSFTNFTSAVEGGLTSMTATFRGDAEQWRVVMQEAMDSGAVSAQASFQVIEDDAGNTFLQMQGQANEWATFLASQSRIAADSFADSMQFMFAEGDSMFGNLTNQAQAFQAIIAGINAPSFPGGGGGTVTIPQFAHGGSFRVGGAGGTDSQYVGFMASPNETVTVQTPAQRTRSSDQPIIINIQSDGEGLSQFIRVVADDHRVQISRSGIRADERVY